MKKLILWITILLFAEITTAQIPEVESEKKLTFAIHPLQIFHWGVRIDTETKMKDNPAWLQVGTTFYPFTYTTEADGWEFGWLYNDRYRSMWGYGIDLNYKYFVHEVLYFSGGPAYHYFNIKYRGTQWVDFNEDGLNYHINEYNLLKQQIHRLGLNTYFGYQKITDSLFLFDAYIGVGFRHGIPLHSDLKSFNSSPLSFGYKGPILLLGIRLGFGI